MASKNTNRVYEEFFQSEEAKTFLKWEKNETDEIRNADGTTPHGVLPNGKTVFEVVDCSKSFKEGGTMITQSDHFDILIPGGFRDFETVNKMNPVKYSLAGTRALMSLVHLIAVPRKDSKIRICNAVTMDQIQHKRLICEMKEALVKGAIILIDGNPDMPGSIRWHLSQCSQVTLPDGTAALTLLNMEDMSPSCWDSYDGFTDGRFGEIINAAKNSIEFSFHLTDVCSIMHLHGHGYAGNLLTLAHDKMEEEAEASGTVKNTPVDEVVEMINSGAVKKMKDDLMRE
jgi:hypothetical protein